MFRLKYSNTVERWTESQRKLVDVFAFGGLDRQRRVERVVEEEDIVFDRATKYDARFVAVVRRKGHSLATKFIRKTRLPASACSYVIRSIVQAFPVSGDRRGEAKGERHWNRQRRRKTKQKGKKEFAGATEVGAPLKKKFAAKKSNLRLRNACTTRRSVS